MKVSLKTAYEIAIKALPNDSLVKVVVNIGLGRWDSRRDPHTVQWSVEAFIEGNEEKNRPDISAIETDPIFSIALAKVAAEISRATVEAARDVVVDEPEAAEAPAEEAPEREENKAF